VALQDLDLDDHPWITVRIGIEEDAVNIGGMNIFGSRFGNYPQDIVMRMRFRA
jgi:predicted transcriptional regulator